MLRALPHASARSPIPPTRTIVVVEPAEVRLEVDPGGEGFVQLGVRQVQDARGDVPVRHRLRRVARGVAGSAWSARHEAVTSAFVVRSHTYECTS